tara:strand:- start:26 stop:319 length:294 start_codon:yes stop_codon:yes gene_type:complete
MPKIIVFKLLTPIDYTESTENTFTYVIKMSNSKEDELVLLYIDKDAKQQLKKFRLASLIERYENEYLGSFSYKIMNGDIYKTAKTIETFFVSNSFGS